MIDRKKKTYVNYELRKSPGAVLLYGGTALRIICARSLRSMPAIAENMCACIVAWRISPLDLEYSPEICPAQKLTPVPEVPAIAHRGFEIPRGFPF